MKAPSSSVTPVPIMPEDTLETLAARVHQAEHEWQPKITDKVVSGEISWDGENPATLVGASLT
jgi:folate-dependent phosphoribosylglycinamide formyltransferase PurN